MPDFIPRRNGDLLNWLANFKEKVQEHGPNLGLDPAVQAEIITICGKMQEKINHAEMAKADAMQAVANAEDYKRTQLQRLRQEINRLKTNADYTSSIGEDLEIIGSGEPPVDPNTYKPGFEGQAFQGYNRIKFTKKGVDGVNVYRREEGAANFTKIAMDTNAPYDDHSITAGTAYEYRCIGVDHDAEIGLPSDVVLVRSL